MKFCSSKYFSRAEFPESSGFPNLKAIVAVGLLALLGACGGGGGSGGTTSAVPPTVTPVTPVTPATPGVTTYALLAGFRALIQAGSVDNFIVSGDCTGTAQTSNGAALPATFEGFTGYSTAESATLTLPSCATAPSTSTGANFYDANFASLGSTTATGGYTVVAGAPLALPASVKVGDAQPAYIVYVLYTDSTKTTASGQVIEGYAIEADTTNTTAGANTAIYHSTSTTYSASNAVLSRQQTFYRMSPDGTLRLLSLDVQYNDTLVASHLVYTRTD